MGDLIDGRGATDSYVSDVANNLCVQVNQGWKGQFGIIWQRKKRVGWGDLKSVGGKDGEFSRYVVG